MKFLIFEVDRFFKTLLRLEQWQKRLAGTRQIETWFGLENRKKTSHIIDDYLYLLFSLLFILWFAPLGEEIQTS